jgi:bromodomain-containing factor 1
LLTRSTHYVPQHNDEIELDIDALPSGTIAQLYNLVIKGIEPGQAPPRKKKTGPKPGQNGQRHQDHAGGPKRPGKKAGGMGGGGKGGGGSKNQSEAERIKMLEAELSRLNQAQETSSQEGESWPALL